MSLKDKLQIILITYNREKHVLKTLKQLFFQGSPISDCEFVVQDNNSMDNTKQIVEEFSETHPNVRYTKNKYNIGISGTIARAMEVASKEYVWIIGDDDLFDFSNWQEVEKAIENNEKIICLARYSIPDEYKNNIAYQLFQLTFITGGIYSTELFNDTTIKNAFDNIYTLFPHLPPIIQFVNDGGKIYVVHRAISDNGMDTKTTDVSYIRGFKNTSNLYDRTKEMTWILGYANIISLLKNKDLRKECLEVAIPYKHIYGCWENFYYRMYNQYIYTGKINYFLEIYKVLPDNIKKYFKRDKRLTFLRNITDKPILEQKISRVVNKVKHNVKKTFNLMYWKNKYKK